MASHARPPRRLILFSRRLPASIALLSCVIWFDTCVASTIIHNLDCVEKIIGRLLADHDSVSPTGNGISNRFCALITNWVYLPCNYYTLLQMRQIVWPAMAHILWDANVQMLPSISGSCLKWNVKLLLKFRILLICYSDSNDRIINIYLGTFHIHICDSDRRKEFIWQGRERVLLFLS